MKKLGMSLFIASVSLLIGCSSQDITDSSVTAAVKSKLTINTDTSAINIGVATTNGVVTLSGTVPTAAERDRASEVAAKTDGVNRVINNINVASQSVGETSAEKKLENTFETTKKIAARAAEEVSEAITDATILAKIKTHLAAQGDEGVNVDVTDGNVVIKGEVGSSEDRSRAATYARNVNGVKSVKNLLTVKKIGK